MPSAARVSLTRPCPAVTEKTGAHAPASPCRVWSERSQPQQLGSLHADREMIFAKIATMRMVTTNPILVSFHWNVEKNHRGARPSRNIVPLIRDWGLGDALGVRHTGLALNPGTHGQ